MLKYGYNFIDELAAQIYAERRFELEKFAGYKNPGRFLSNRCRTRDAAGAAFTYRMSAGFPGDVNRTHPASIEPCLIDATSSTTYPTFYGQPVLVDSTTGSSATYGVRSFVSGDSAATDLYGVTVRPFPLQGSSATGSFGSGTPPTSGVIDILRMGYIIVQLGDGTLTGAQKNSAVYVFLGSTGSHHVLGGFEASSSGSPASIAAANATFNNIQDANGWVEVAIHQG